MADNTAKRLIEEARRKEVEKMSAFEFFLTEVGDDLAAVKIAAVNKLNVIAFAMGPGKVVQDLVPFLKAAAEEEPFCNDEEFLFSLAKQYAILPEYMGGNEELLFPPLENLAAQEETVIRDQAVTSLCSIVAAKSALAAEHLFPAVQRLAKRSDFFTARVSACALLPCAYKYTNTEHRKELRQTYQLLCQDDTPMVRRAAANKMKEFVAECDKADLLSEMVTTLKTLSQEDTQDTIRVACVQTTLVFAKAFDTEENKTHTLNIIKEKTTDRSWRVRLTVIKNFTDFCEAFGPEMTGTDLMECLATLLKDNEQEVRKEAVKIIEPLLTKGSVSSDQLEKHILPQFTELSKDPAQPVRAALAQAIGPVAKSIGKEKAHKELLPLITELMKDEFHDVRLNIVSHSGLLCEVLGVQTIVDNLLQPVQNLIMDNHWRIRMTVVEQVPKLAGPMGVEMFQSKLESLFLSSLRDSVHSVREAACTQLKPIVEKFGVSWTLERLLPKLVEQYTQTSGYAIRVTTLTLMPQVASALPADKISANIVPLMIKGMTDPVPNVRFCACKQTQLILKLLSDKTELRQQLTQLRSDSDIDVQYFASLALKDC